MQAQIFGSDPVCMAEAADSAIEASGADILDINMGCPVGKVVNNGDGSALMRDPEKAARIAEAVVKAVKAPVTVKMRRGWDKGSINAPEPWRDAARERRRRGHHCPRAHARADVLRAAPDWSTIRAVKEAVKIPVIANGDVFTPENAIKSLKLTGADAVMIGRGCFGNPWLFQQCRAALVGEPIPPLPPLAERIEATASDRFCGQDQGRTAGMSQGAQPVLSVSARCTARQCLQAGGRARRDTRRPAAHHARHPA